MTTKYLCDDGNGEIEIEADSAEDAAQEYVDGGVWDRSTTCWIRVYVTPVDEDGDAIADERESITITLDAEEPDCEDGEEHDWRSPYSVLGGPKENPGVWGHGGGIISKSVCAHCGKYRVRDTWAQNPATGEQGLESVEYEDADEVSLDWLARRQMRACEAELEGNGRWAPQVVSYETDGNVIRIVADSDEAAHEIESCLAEDYPRLSVYVTTDADESDDE